jgi:thiol-disulfide isomerase/thioredoxin
MTSSALVRRSAFVCALIIGAAFYRPETAIAVDRSSQWTFASATLQDDAETASADASEFSFWDKPRALPALHFTDRKGRPLTLRAFRGRPILLNIWAPWCIPCRKEMPALDQLQAEVGASHLLVLPLSIDRRGLAAVEKFYEQNRLTSLGIYLDRSGDAASELDTVGVPMTLLIDRSGQEVGRRLGGLSWDDPKVVAVIRKRLGLQNHTATLRP